MSMNRLVPAGLVVTGLLGGGYAARELDEHFDPVVPAVVGFGVAVIGSNMTKNPGALVGFAGFTNPGKAVMGLAAGLLGGALLSADIRP